MTQKVPYNPWQMDVRVRERNLKSGSLTDKELEKNLAALSDVADQSEPFATQQPALEQKHVAPPHAPVAHASGAADDDLDDDDLDDEDEDLDDDGDGDGDESPAPVADVDAPEAPATASESDDTEGQP